MNLDLVENNNSDFSKQNSAVLTVSESAEKRILEIKSKTENQNKFLRILVSGGGCSGFQYHFNLDNKIADDDLKIEKNGQILVAVDQVSLELVHDSVLDFVSELGGSYFKMTNPNAKASCGCGSSFSV